MDSIIDFVQLLITSTLRMSVPIVLGAVGAAFSMRSGVSALGIEGMMITGAFFGILGTLQMGNTWFGILFAVIGAILISLIHAFLHVTHKVNASLSGICINLIGLSMTELMLKVLWDTNMYSPQIKSFEVFAPNWLSSIPFVGKILAEQYIFIYLVIIIVLFSHLFMYKTKYGLRLRMTGEDPVAAHSVGINTVAYKYFGVIMSGALSGLAGAYLSMAMMSNFQVGMTAGRGYIAMVAANLSKSTPIGAALSGLFFGIFNALQTMFQGVNFPSQILMAMPYVFTLIASAISIGKLKGPSGVGRHFDEA